MDDLENFVQIKKALENILQEIADLRSEINKLKENSLNQEHLSELLVWIHEIEDKVLKGGAELPHPGISAPAKPPSTAPTVQPPKQEAPWAPYVTPERKIPPAPEIPKPPAPAPPITQPTEPKIEKPGPPPLPPITPTVQPKPSMPPKPPVQPRPPAPPPPPPKPFDWNKFEAWLIFAGTRVGVFVIVLGLGYLLSIGFSKLGVFGKAMCVYAACGGMLITGVVFERWEKYSTWARIIIAGGWSGLYITTFFVYYMPQARLITDPFLDVALLMCIAAGMIVHSLKYRSESLTTLTYFVAFITISLSIKFTDETFFSLISNTVLAVSMLIIVFKTRWYRLALFSINACYGAHTFWLSPLVSVFHKAGGHDRQFWTGLAMLGVYWLTFTIAAFIARPGVAGGKASESAPAAGSKTREEALALWLAAINYVEFMAVFRYHVGSTHPELRWLFTGAIALVYIALAFLAYSLKRNNLYTLNLVIAALSTTMTIYFRFLGGNWLAVMWLLEAEALYVAGLLANEKRFRWIGIANFVLVGWWILFKDIYQTDSVSLFGFSFYVRTLIFGTTAVVFYINSVLRHTFSHRISAENRYSHLFAYAASVLWLILMMENWYPDDLLRAGVVGAALSLILMETGIRTRDYHFRIQGLIYAFLSVLWAIAPLAMGESLYYVRGIYYRIGCEAAVIVFAYAVFARFQRLTKKEGEVRPVEIGAAVFSAAAGTLILVLTLRQELIVEWPMFIAVTWLIAAVGLVEMGTAINNRFLRFLALALCVLAFIYALLYNLDGGISGWGFNSRLVTLSLCIVALYYIHERFVRAVGRGVQLNAPTDMISDYLGKFLPKIPVSPSAALSWIAGALVILLIQREIWVRWPAWVGEAWLLPMAAFLIMAKRRSSLNFLAQGLLTATIIFLWTMIVTVSAQSQDFSIQLESQRLWAASPIIVVFYFMFGFLLVRPTAILSADRARHNAYIRDIFSWYAVVTLLALVTFEVSNVSDALTAVVWIGIALILYETGRHLENVSLKSQAYLITAVSFCRAMLINLDKEYGRVFDSPITGRTASVVYIVAGLYYLYIRLLKSEKDTVARISETDFGRILSYLALILLSSLVYVEMKSPWVPPVWTCIMIAVMLAGILLRERHLVYQAFIMVVPVAIGMLFLDFPGHGTMQCRVGSGIAIGALFVARILWQIGIFNNRDKLGPDFQTGFIAGQCRHLFSMPAAALLAILISIEFHGDLSKYLTIALACEGFFIMMLGFGLKDRVLRFTGLFILIFCILKVPYDLWVLDIGRVYKVIALIGLGAILIAIGLVYSRYRDSIKKILTEE